ncbi:hypothetical protein SNSL254_A2911 [Salmonella enterica subsp. enterica serovar Newport str. SL254]|uniref:Uncharacterized protein n=1 Tax=Salmonella newport (strain SL254) TaxID=423368 RepID=A0A0H3BQ69_SALNS|nr:hypothetical protein SNSL254_A2911 [Salmonella enterica subsp. enterica serovar Newport str. SL254]AGS30776.1 hypothetical protein SN31241_38050 [Salmonella enterica subsp. enterica serovar Newport str. USMARC-S3124.1]
MGVTHCHLYIMVPQYFLKRQYVATGHHKVSGESMAQDMC